VPRSKLEFPTGPTRSDASAHANSQAVLNALRRVVLALRVWAQEAEGVFKVSGAQLFVLQKLADDQDHTVNGLAQRTLTSKSSVSVVVARLVQRGLVKRRPSPSDGRSAILSLTAAGRAIVERGPESPQSRVLSALSRLPRHDLATLAVLLDEFVAELGLQTMEPRMLFENATAEGRSRPGRTRRAVTNP